MAYCMPRYARIARAMGAVFASEEEGAQEAVRRVKELTKEVGLPTFASRHVEEKDFDALAQMSVNNGSNGSNPRPMTKEDYLNILRAAYADGE
jgi:alcohol dehydrogenase